jgi:hypothetical protein
LNGNRRIGESSTRRTIPACPTYRNPPGRDSFDDDLERG